MGLASLFRSALESPFRSGKKRFRPVVPRSRRLTLVEPLEQRQLLAANVAVLDTGDDAGFAAIVNQLNDNTQGLNITATLVQPTDIDSAAELNAYDVVLLGDDGSGLSSFAAVATELNAWAKNHGGGIVAVGFIGSGVDGDPEEALLDEIIPVTIAGNSPGYAALGDVVDVIASHPVTTLVNDITIASDSLGPNFSEAYPSADFGTVLGTISGGAQNGKVAIVAGDIPSGSLPGRSVYLGPIYAASAAYDTDQWRAGDGDRLLEQAVNWAANVPSSAAPLITTNTGSTVVRGGIDTITQGELQTTDADTPASGLTYTVTTLPVNGTLSSLIFTQADINAGTVTYAHNGSATSGDAFSFNVSDGTTTVPGTFAFSITSGVSLSIAVTDGIAAEPGNDGAFTVALSQPVGTDTTITYNVTGTATNGVDYQPLIGILTIPAGSTSAVLPVDIIDDTLVEGPERVFVALSTVSGGVTIDLANDDAELIIGDNDPTGLGPTVTVDGNGTLIVQGTSDDDTVTITGVGTGTGNYTVTTQRGNGPVVTQAVTGVIGGFDINLHAGNDSLTINNAYLNGPIEIRMEEGNDSVILGLADVVSSASDLNVDLGAGDDTIVGQRLYIGGDQLILGGDGDDELIFEGVASPTFTLGTSAGGNAVWQGGSGDDVVSVVYGFIVGSWVVQLGDGQDTLDVFGSAASGDVSFSGEGDADTLTVDTNFFDASLALLGGGGDDAIFLANGLGTEFGSIETGAGADRVTLRNQTTSQLSVDTGAGSDEVDVRASAFDRFFASLGDDNDSLLGQGNLVRLQTSLDGGAGSEDRLTDLGNSFKGVFNAQGFERFGQQ